MLQHLKESDLEMVRGWRNAPDVRRVMFTDHLISAEEHRRWWRGLKADGTREVLVFLADGQPLGVINFFDIDRVARSCHWGFYLGDAAALSNRNKVTVWIAVEGEAIAYAFEELGCESLHCETYSFNVAVLQMHERFGFRRTGVERRERNGIDEEVILMTLDRPAKQATSGGLSFAFLGSANWDVTGKILRENWTRLTGEQCEVLDLPFGQYRAQLADPKSALHSLQPDCVILAERFEDFLPSPFACFDTLQVREVEERFEDYLRAIRMARERLDGMLLVLDLAATRAVSTTLNERNAGPDSVAAVIARLNGQLSTVCNELPDTLLVGFSAVVRNVGAELSDPGKYWYLARLALSSRASDALARRLVATVLSRTGKTARLVVADLDNTLWGGVVGDDGIAGLQLGGDFPGNAYAAIQYALKALSRRGIALAICSKNTKEVALDAIRRHPGMVLTEADFVTSRINWQDKADNIRSIADELSLGLGSVFVLDDSPYERDAIRAALPQAIVPDPPADIAEWPRFLVNHPYLSSLSLTEEDKARVERYRARRKAVADEANFTSREDYLRSLKMRLGFHGLAESNCQRILQLIAKTNQFNMTTRRYGEAQLDDLLRRGATVIGVSLSDKYSEPETIGVLILLPEDEDTLRIDTFLLSCRVLGRTVESAVIGWVARFAAGRGFSSISGELIATDRNGPAMGVYPELGFTETGPGMYQLDLHGDPLAMPPWFAISDEVSR